MAVLMTIAILGAQPGSESEQLLVKLIFDQLSGLSEEFATCPVAAVEPDNYTDLALSVGCISDCISARTLIASPTSFFTVSFWRDSLVVRMRVRLRFCTQ
jgi:hypothetical protein